MFKDTVKAITRRDGDEDTPEPKSRRRGETEGGHVPTADHGSDQPAARGRFAMLQPAKAEQAADDGAGAGSAAVGRKFTRAANDATERPEIPPEFWEDAPVMDWWQQQQMFGWNDFNNDDGFDYGDDFGGGFDSPGPPDFPAPHL
jgi:hypothetical protein